VETVFTQQAPEVKVRIIGGETDSAILTERDGEPVVVSALDQEGVASAQVVLLAGGDEATQRGLQMIREVSPAPPVIDLTYGLEEEPEIELRAPLVEPPGWQGASQAHYLITHPASIVLADFFQRLADAHPMERSVVHIFEPASERGKEGIDELHRQTVQLFSFQTLPQEVFDAQLSFNMLPRYGAEAPARLEAVETRIRRHLSVLLERSGTVPAPSMRLAQAPVFHGYSISAWVEFEEAVKPQDLMKALASERIEVRSLEEPPPTNVGVVGQSGATVGVIEPDPANARAAWFWMASDNHRVLAENAVCLAHLLVPGEGAA